MGELLEDLLEISRVGLIINAPQDVDLRDLIDEAVRRCSGRIRDQGIELRIADELPALRVDGGRIVQVFQNLIDNACKYMGRQAKPCVAIDAREENDKTVIVVRDNGIGIEPRYHDRIFRLFDKLDPSSEGTGIGLALVKRIIEIHGGRIWVESKGTGNGTAFCFILPPATPSSSLPRFASASTSSTQKNHSTQGQCGQKNEH
ncbi:MAG: GHKL domain-containing protein [bacterium]|nr:GHKL domain-containing protein [bacterium]